MATSNDILNIDSYRPNPVLGGVQGIGVTIDPTPIGRLAAFTYYADRDKWEQKQKDDFRTAQQIADIAAYDTTSPFKPYTDDLTKDANDLTKYLKDNPNILKYDPNNPTPYLDVWSKIGKLENKRKHATANDVLYNAEKNKIDLIPDPAERDRQKRLLDIKVNNLFSDGIEPAYSRQFEAVPPPKPQDSIIPVAASTQRSIIVPLPNSDVTTEVTYTDPADLMAKSVMKAAGQNRDEIKDQDWFKRLSPAEQTLELEGGTSIQLSNLQKTTDNINGLFKQWQAANPNIDVNTVDVNLLPNDSFGNNIRWARSINAQIDELNGLVLEGKIKDPSGGVRTTPYDKINLIDGLSPAEMIFMKSVQDSKVPLIQKVEKKITTTNDEIERMRINAEWGRLGIEKDKLNKAGKEDLYGADVVLRTLSNIISKGEKATTWGGRTTTADVFTISDPTLLQQFGKIDKEGVHFDIPDAVQYNKNIGQLNLVYYKMDSDGKVEEKDGQPIVDQNKTKQLDERTWIAETTKQFFPNKDIGGINVLINDAIVKNGNSLYNVANIYSAQGANPPKNKPTTTEIPTGTMQEWLSTPGWDKDKIKKAVKAGKIKVQ